MKRLGEDTNLKNFSDRTLLNFDKCLSDESNKTGYGFQKGKTRYHLMMATFGKPSTGRNTAPTASAAARARNSSATSAPSIKPPSTEAPEPLSKAALVRTSKDRTSKVQMLGQVVRDKLLISIRKRKYHWSTKKSNEALLGLLMETSVVHHTSNVMETCHRSAR